MERILEPELMDDFEQALAYTNADFSESHGRRVAIFRETFPDQEVQGNVLDLGCGSGDITFRFARAFPKSSIVAVDGSRAMLALAEREREKDPDLQQRVTFLEGYLPGAPLPRQNYVLIMSHSFLHHLHKPAGLWQTILAYALPGTRVFVADLRRPTSGAEAQKIIDTVAINEPEVLRRDFYNSLCAAFEPQEIREQLREAGLPELRVEATGDFHLIVYGVRT